MGAQIASLLANAHKLQRRDGKPITAADFLPGEREANEPIDLETAMQTWA